MQVLLQRKKLPTELPQHPASDEEQPSMFYFLFPNLTNESRAGRVHPSGIFHVLFLDIYYNKL